MLISNIYATGFLNHSNLIRENLTFILARLKKSKQISKLGSSRLQFEIYFIRFFSEFQLDSLELKFNVCEGENLLLKNRTIHRITGFSNRLFRILCYILDLSRFERTKAKFHDWWRRGANWFDFKNRTQSIETRILQVGEFVYLIRFSTQSGSD